MPVLHSHQLPSGETVEFHEVLSLNWSAGSESASVAVRSWESKEARDSGSLLSWVAHHFVPVESLHGSVADAIEEYLVGDDGPMAGGSIINASTELEEAKAIRWAQLRALRDSHIGAGFDVPGVGRFDSDQNSRSLLTGAVTGAQLAVAAGMPFSVDWTLADNSVVTLDAAGIFGVGLALLTHVSAWHAVGRSAREAIESAETIDDARAVTLTAP